MNPLREPRAVDLRRLIGVVTRVHDDAMHNTFSDPPILEPLLFTLRDMGGERIKGYLMDGLPRDTWDRSVPAHVLASVGPVPGAVPDDFCGCLFTFEAWFHKAPTTDPAAVDELIRTAERREVWTLATKQSARITMAYATDGQWVQFIHLEGASAPVVSTSQSAEHNPDHYRGWHSSGVNNALAGLVHRIQADIDSRYEEGT